jgi:hypothetical protein
MSWGGKAEFDAAFQVLRPLVGFGSKMRKTHIEYMFSALPLIATVKRTFRIGSFVPTAAIGHAHSITLSARASSVGGISSPNALAVFRLM